MNNLAENYNDDQNELAQYVFKNPMAEQSVLGALMINPTRLDDVRGIITVDAFFEFKHRNIFRAICEAADSNTPTDPVTVAERIAASGEEPDMDYLTELHTGVGSAVNAMGYAGIVANCAIKRRLWFVAAEFSRYLNQNPHVSGLQAVEYAQARIMELNDNTRQQTESVEFNTALKTFVDQLDERFSRGDEINGLETGLTTLDHRLNGYKPGSLIVIAGRPSQGKTTVAMNFAEQFSVVRKKRGIIYSLEMTDSELVEQMIASTGRISRNHLSRPATGGEELWVKLTTAVGRCKDAPLEIVDCSGIHINQLKSHARKCHRRQPLDYIMVDHMHLMDADGDRNVDKFGAISRGCKQLAKELGIPVFLLAQLSRKVEERGNKRPLLSDLRESGRIEEDADIVHFIYRDEYYNPQTQSPGVMELNTAKFRGGKVGVDYLGCNLEMARVSDLAPESCVPPELPPSTRQMREALL